MCYSPPVTPTYPTLATRAASTHTGTVGAAPPISFQNPPYLFTSVAKPSQIPLPNSSLQLWAGTKLGQFGAIFGEDHRPTAPIRWCHPYTPAAAGAVAFLVAPSSRVRCRCAGYVRQTRRLRCRRPKLNPTKSSGLQQFFGERRRGLDPGLRRNHGGGDPTLPRFPT